MPEPLYDPEVRRIAMDEPVAVTPCPVCDHDRARPTFTIDGLAERVVTCEGCGLGRLEPRPSAERIATFYADEYYGDAGAKFNPALEAVVRGVSALRARRLIGDLGAGARVLDLGCGRGVLLSAFADRGLEVHGVEVSETATRGADPRARIRIASRLAEAGYPPDHFDLVVVWHVLEHLPDPRETLIEVHRVLRPGGRLAVAVPNFSSLQARWAGPAWFHLDLPRHLFHYPLPALIRLADRCGFEARSIGHLSLSQDPFGWVQSALNRHAALPRNALYAMLQRGYGARARSSLTTLSRLGLGVAFLAGLPAAVPISLIAAARRSGAAVHLTAMRRA